jgi:hypothetical protein
MTGERIVRRKTIRSRFSDKGWYFGFLPPRDGWRGENTAIEASLDVPLSGNGGTGASPSFNIHMEFH